MSEKSFKDKQDSGIRIMETCARCRKQITPPSRFGSLTSYLFAENRCKCADAVPIPAPAPAIVVVAGAAQGSDSTTDNHGRLVDPGVPSQQPDLGERYEVLELIGQGGMGAVWKVRDKQLDTLLAIKVLRKELASDGNAVKRFEQEAQAASRLTQNNLVSVYGSGITGDNSPYLIMDYLEGENLADLLRREQVVAPTRAIEIALQVCEALSHAHEKGIVHRDLKPSNIILTKNSDGVEVIKLVDFGIAKVMPSVNEQTNNMTQTGEMFGSPLYMSPEHCKGDKIDGRSDIYSFGCVMHELITGQPAFEADNQIKIILKQLGESPPPLKQAGLPVGLSDIIQRCLEKDPAARYQSIEQLKNELTTVSSGKIPSGRTLNIGRRLAAVAIDAALMTVIAMLIAAVFIIGLESFSSRSTGLMNGSFLPNLHTSTMWVFVFMAIDCICLWASCFMAHTFVTINLTQLHTAMEASKHLSPDSPQMLQNQNMMESYICTAFVYVSFIIVNWLYHSISETSGWQGTLGMRLCKLKVVNKNGSPINFWQASVRHFTKIVMPFQIFLLTFIYMFFGSARVRSFMRTGYGTKLKAVLIHDWLSGCRVRKR